MGEGQGKGRERRSGELGAGYYLGLCGIAAAVALGELIRGSYGPAALILAGIVLLLLMARRAYRRDGRL
jgi:hypothetical protein